MDNLSEFANGRAYDAQYGHLYTDDIAYLTHLLPETGGPVLDLCCGTGIVSIPLAQQGVEVIGVDLSQPMLDWARAKSQGLPVRWVHSDVLAYEPVWRFGLITMTGNALQMFLDDTRLLGLFQRVAEWLSDEGSFVFDTRLPTPQQLHPYEEEVELARFLDSECHEVVELATRYYDSISQCQTWHKRRLRNGEQQHSQITLRYSTIEQLESMMYEAGLQVQARFADWQQTPFQREAHSIVYRLGRIRRP
ncbi:class I SAM-dependent methyltransferase [Pokkaliibacter sp. MBI-7]|uniref:class I SAM-dependent DNA methyltransferase n=1 Tax=Pokkaliibacter sp. MBI-7 TaxID=3040600 RepID=UPI002446B026|nr:class I SAM-dependent methyltransferase [Pokkaliibacter sp. MBI-7]MDH2433474.1 class I SAM-dependent methyltransferase [Pokkaliibacter sp. MBI-7]